MLVVQKRSYHVVKSNGAVTQIITVHNDSNRFFCKQRKGRDYVNRYVPECEVYTVERRYRRNKSIAGLEHLIVRVKCEGTQQYDDCMCVVYTLSTDNGKEDAEGVKILPHKNSKQSD